MAAGAVWMTVGEAGALELAQAGRRAEGELEHRRGQSA